MEIGVLLESAEKGIFLECEVQLLEDLSEWGALRGRSKKSEASRRHGMLWEGVKVSDSASGSC